MTRRATPRPAATARAKREGATPRVAAKREAFREQILDAAMKAVEEGGLEALSVKRLAKDLGVALGGIYHYVDGIEEVLVLVEHRALSELGVAMAAAEAKNATKPALARLSAVIRVFVDEPERAPARHRLVDALLSAPDPLLSPAQAARAELALATIHARVSRIFEECVAEGTLAPGDADVRTLLVWAAIHGLDHFRKRDARVPRKLRHRALVGEMVLENLDLGAGGQALPVRHAERHALVVVEQSHARHA